MSQVATANVQAISARGPGMLLARRVAASFAVVLGCYWVYVLVAVPLIEPNVEQRTAHRASDEQIEAARGEVTQRQRSIAQYFSASDWEANHPAIVQSGQVRLLFATMTPQSDGSVELHPCTLMFFPKSGGAGPERPVIMRAEKGANIRFDQPIVSKSIDPSRKFESGTLRGPIHIQQRESAPGAADDLEITTRHDVELDSERAWSEHPVYFRLGRSQGSGRDLEILLAAAESADGQGLMRGATLHKLLLKRDVRMRLEMAAGPSAPDAQPRPEDRQPPIEITCQGEFEFDIEDYAASFHEQVDVFRLHPIGESDQLNCQLLTIFFFRPGELPPETHVPGAEPSQASPPVRLIEARGDPVTLRSPAQGMYARCHGVDYIPGPAGSPGTLIAFGPGVIHGNLPNDPAGKYVGQWARELRFEPDGSLQRATLRGATMVRFGQLGTITADEVFAWLSQKPVPPEVALVSPGQTASGANADAWQVERIVARRYTDPRAQGQGDVVIDAPQLHAEATVLEATIDRRAMAIPTAGQPNVGEPHRPNEHRVQPTAQAQGTQRPNERFEVTGRSVRIRLVPQGDDLAVADATIERDARLEQFAVQPADNATTLLVKGDRLHVSDAHNDATKVAIAGGPGYVEAGGMTLWGNTIELEKHTNRLWVVGSGRLAMPVAQDLDGRPLAQPQTLTVDWKERMDFQSDTADFRGKVVARNAQQVLNTERLEATLTQAVDFSNPNAGRRPDERLDLAGVRSHGRTFLESRQFDEQGEQDSFSQMELYDLSIERASGQIRGAGPGWVKHLTRGNGLQAPSQRSAAGARPPPADDKDGQLTYLHVTFQQGIEGNIDQRAIKFFDRTKTVYGPVADWNARLDPNDRPALGPNGMTLEAGVLEVREMTRRPGSQRGWFELDASGSVVAEGAQFTALGDRLTYAEQNDQLTLRGEPAEMFIENASGERHEQRAQLVHYWTASQRVSVSGGQAVNLQLPPAQRKPSGQQVNP